jgi:hypothetical protein
MRIKWHGVSVIFGLLFLLGGNAPSAEAARLRLSPSLTQQEFSDFTREAGLSISYLPLAPAEPLGILGFDAGVETTLVDIRQDHSYWRNVSDDSLPSYLFIPKIHVQKGLPFGIDVGAVYSKINQLDTTMVGGEVKWALLSGNALLPAVALRGSYTKLSGSSEVDVETYGVDLSASKGLGFITPYAGIGQVWVRSSENNDLLALEDERIDQFKAYAGVKVTFLVINFVGEVHYAHIPIYTTRLNLAF